jgi:hypothetical protein
MGPDNRTDNEEVQMLHMVVNTHNPESCAFRDAEQDEALSGAIDRLGEQAGGHGVTIRSSWINRASHEIFMLVDAPHAHAVEELLVKAGLVGRSHTRILPVIATEDAVAEH